MARRITTVVFDLQAVIKKHHIGLGKPKKDNISPLFLAFARQNVSLSFDEMQFGILQKDQIQSILTIPSVVKKWKFANNNRLPDLKIDTERMYDCYEALELQQLYDGPDCIRPVPTAAVALSNLKEMGIQIGCTTGFTQSLFNVVSAQSSITSFFDVMILHPGSSGILETMIKLRCKNVDNCVKVADTQAGIKEGHAAGVRTIGLTRSSEFARKFTSDLDSLETRNDIAYRSLMQNSSKHLKEVGPTYIVPKMKDMVELVHFLNGRC